jgi:hypothetical protein
MKNENSCEGKKKSTWLCLSVTKIILSHLMGLAWLVIMCSRSDVWVYWHFFTITVTCNSSHIEILLDDVCLANLSQISDWSLLSLTHSLKLSLSFMLRPTVSRPVCLWIKHPFGAYDQILITVRQLRVCWCGTLSLWREDGSVVCNWYWPSPAQSFSGPSLLGLVAIFYCLDSSLKVTVLSMWGALSHERSGLSFVSHNW